MRIRRLVLHWCLPDRVGTGPNLVDVGVREKTSIPNKAFVKTKPRMAEYV